ncbi:MAG: 1-deoxy-D-xylulose-5-phosphate synthase [Bacilli bacterium]|nr:1-deoxy-D-xylulose-5-phosphate synthase [Bacilli bacterium]
MSTKKTVKHIDLKSIENPNFLKDLSYKELDVLSGDIRDYIVDAVSKNGGHLASNLGVIDATIALCRSFDFSKDKIIFDVGHQCYTYKVLTGRSLDNLRQKDGVSGFQKREESPYDHYECGHSSTSISAANGMAIARDLKGENYEIVAFIGDASVVNGLSFEGLNNLTQSEHKVIIILNDNDMSIVKPVGAVARSFRRISNSVLYRRSKRAYQRFLKKNRFGRWILKVTSGFKNWFKRHVVKLNVFDMVGLTYYGPVDGHDIKDLEKIINRAKKNSNSSVIHIKTLKGRGYKPSENDDTGTWHGVGKFNKETGEIYKKEGYISWSKEYADCLDKAMEEHQEAMLIFPATGTGSELVPLMKKYPTRFIDVGIAEEHAFTLSSGLAVSGLHPVISIYSTFLQRAYDELSHDLARMNLNATVLVDRAGLVGNDGNTHQGIYDEQFLLGIPNVVVAMASRQYEANALLEESFHDHGVFCIRFPRESFIPSEEKSETVPFGKWKVELNEGNTAIVTFGPVILELKENIIKNNIKATLINAIYQNPMDDMMIQNLLKYDRIIIYDPYGVEAGFATSLSSKLARLSYKGKVILKAVPNLFIEHASIQEQREKYGISVNDIIALL